MALTGPTTQHRNTATIASTSRDVRLCLCPAMKEEGAVTTDEQDEVDDMLKARSAHEYLGVFFGTGATLHSHAEDP